MTWFFCTPNGISFNVDVSLNYLLYLLYHTLDLLVKVSSLMSSIYILLSSGTSVSLAATSNWSSSASASIGDWAKVGGAGLSYDVGSFFLPSFFSLSLSFGFGLSFLASSAVFALSGVA
jgi:hypothetical protein